MVLISEFEFFFVSISLSRHRTRSSCHLEHCLQLLVSQARSSIHQATLTLFKSISGANQGEIYQLSWVLHLRPSRMQITSEKEEESHCPNPIRKKDSGILQPWARAQPITIPACLGLHPRELATVIRCPGGVTPREKDCGPKNRTPSGGL